MSEYVSLDIKFNYKLLGKWMHEWRRAHDLTQSDCDDLLGMIDAWAEYERRRHHAVDYEYATQIRMATLLSILNLMDAPDNYERLLLLFYV